MKSISNESKNCNLFRFREIAQKILGVRKSSFIQKLKIFVEL